MTKLKNRILELEKEIKELKEQEENWESQDTELKIRKEWLQKEEEILQEQITFLISLYHDLKTNDYIDKIFVGKGEKLLDFIDEKIEVLKKEIKDD